MRNAVTLGVAMKSIKAPQPPSRGLGDTVAKITKAVGIQPCGGCQERQAALNRLVPYSGVQSKQKQEN